MKTTVNSEFSGGGKYTAPEIEMYESVVECGFQLSKEYLLYGDPNYAGDSFADEDGDGGFNDLGSF